MGARAPGIDQIRSGAASVLDEAAIGYRDEPSISLKKFGSLSMRVIKL
jgi:hypothetical protein